jgi:hypothetical protein
MYKRRIRREMEDDEYQRERGRVSESNENAALKLMLTALCVSSDLCD